MKTKRYIIILTSIMLLAINIGFKLPPDCSKVKKGKFYYFNKKTQSKVLIERSDSVQIETNGESGHILTSKIIWKNSCSYDMYINSLSVQKLTGLDSLISTIPAVVDIIQVEDGFYIYSAKMEIAKRIIELKDTMFFVK